LVAEPLPNVASHASNTAATETWFSKPRFKLSFKQIIILVGTAALAGASAGGALALKASNLGIGPWRPLPVLRPESRPTTVEPVIVPLDEVTAEELSPPSR
jgi:hypothetical protein